MASICPGGESGPQAGGGSGGNRPPGGSGSGGNRPPGGGSGSGGNRTPGGGPSGGMSPPVPGGANGMTTEVSAEGCTCMPSMMVMMTKLTAEQMGGQGQGGSGGGSRPPMGGSGSGSPPQGGSGSGGRPPMGGSGSGGNRPPGGSGSGRPPMGGSGNGPPPAGRAAKPQMLRESFNAEVTVGKKSYDCQFSEIYTAVKVDGKKSKARCKGIKKGAVKQITVTSPNGFSFTMDMKFSAKGAAMSKITVE